MAELGRPDWQFRAYEALAADYLARERYLDNVATWQVFVAENPLDARAPAAHEGMIETLIAADFPSQVLPAKADYVARYGVYSDFWTLHGGAGGVRHLPTLRAYLDELAALDHAKAQALAQDAPERAGAFLAAAGRYEEWLATFPDDPDTANTLFLLAETYTEAVADARAVDVYRRVVSEFPDEQRANEAGYALVLGLGRLANEPGADAIGGWRDQAIEAQIDFAVLFPGDERSPSVRVDAASDLYELGRFNKAIDVARAALDDWPALEAGLTDTSLGIVAHGSFELGRYSEAEQAYAALIARTGTEGRADLEERLLASVYRQAEQAEGAGAVDEAVGHYLRLGRMAPGHALAAQGHFDAAAVLEKSGRERAAADELVAFRAAYPDHPLAEGLELRLATMFEELEDPRAAAREYVAVSNGSGDAQVRREALYRAAELYLALDDSGLAIEQFRAYASAYAQPADLRMEAAHHLETLYGFQGQDDERRYWLRRLVEYRDASGPQTSERATWLAAGAQMELAEEARVRFEAVRLAHPLPRSLKAKQSALTESVAAYQKVAEYEVAEFATAATFRIADLYASLSRSLLDSERPAGLNELELEQYEILLEEQAFPFEEQAIAIHEINVRRSWSGVYDDWVRQSFAELGRLMPARFDKQELEVAYVDTLH
jgi:TolA-binding protein